MTPPKSAAAQAEAYASERATAIGPIKHIEIVHAVLVAGFKAGHAAGLAEAGELVEAEWKEIRKWKPFLHWCPDWDFLLIDKGDAEFEACNCFKAFAGEK